MNNIFLAVTYNGPKLSGDGSSLLKNLSTLLFGALGSISVMVIVYAGIRLSASRGNPDAIAKLRSTIIYAAIGLFLAIGAGSIISFVIGKTA